MDVQRVPAVDRELVIAAQRGDQVAFVDLVRARVDRLYAIARRILRDVDRAEDALQDALVIAWRDLPDLRDPDRFDFWVQRLVANMCIEHARRDRRRYAHLQVLTFDGPAAPDQLAGVVDRDIVDRAFRRLTPEERAVLVLRYYLGYEPTMIADVLGVPAGTIRSRLHHAHRAMRAAIEADARAVAVGGSSA
jgi:RNA polymerase sigma-70 factor (ECF subfamily)